MAYLKKEELNFLIELENELGKEEGWSDRVTQLWNIIERHSKECEKRNEITAQKIAEKRKTDKSYRRSKKEKMRIWKKQMK